MTQDPRAFGLPARHEEEFARPDLGDSAEVLLLLEDLVDASPAMEAALERLDRPAPVDSAEFEEALLLAMLAHHAGAPADVVERRRRELADAWDRTREGPIT